MSAFPKRNKASPKQNRLAYSKWVRHLGGSLDDPVRLDPLTIPDFFPGEPDFAGYVPRDDQDTDIDLLIPMWAEGAPSAGWADIITIQWKLSADTTYQDVGTIIKTGPNELGDPPVPAVLNKMYFAREGVYDLRYFIAGFNGTNNWSEPDVTIVIDKTAPHGGQRPNQLTYRDTTEVVNGVITKAYLESQGNQLPMEVPPYNDEKPGDTIEVFLANDPTPEGTPVYEGPIGPNRVIFIPGDRLEALLDGPIFINYYLLDKVGNIGDKSLDTTGNLILVPLPTGPLNPLRVPLAEDAEKLIDMDDVRLGNGSVDVLIPPYTPWSSRDQIEVDWGGIKRALYPVSTAPVADIRIPISYLDVLKPAYAPGTPREKPTNVTYKLIRGNEEVDATPIGIFVDLSFVGPPNPDEPDEENPDLPEVTVKGGGPNPVDNVLTVDDIGLSATIEVEIYTPYALGERMWFYWGTLETPVATYDPDPNSPPPGDVVTVTVDWEYIEQVPGGLVDVYYKIGLISGNNRQKSVATPVDVSAAVPIRLASPQFPSAEVLPGGVLILNCYSFLDDDQHVPVFFPGNPDLLSLGDTVDIVWQPYNDFGATNPVPTPWIKNGRTLTQDEIDNGFTENIVPYADHTEPVGRDGAIRVTYTFNGTSGPIGGTTLIAASTTKPGGVCEPGDTKP
jgi:hypothetical protein